MKIKNFGAGLYRLSCSENGNQYIGSSSNVLYRLGQHIASLDAGKHDNAKLQADWIEFGSRSFSMEMIEKIPDKGLRLAAERILIERSDYSTLYNKVWNVSPKRLERRIHQENNRYTELKATILNEYITILDFAKRCGCSRRTVYRWMKDGVLDYDTAPGPNHFIKKSVMEQFLAR